MPSWTDRERESATIEDIMDALRVDDLKAVAKKLGLPSTLTRKDQLSAALADYLNTVQPDQPHPRAIGQGQTVHDAALRAAQGDLRLARRLAGWLLDRLGRGVPLHRRVWPRLPGHQKLLIALLCRVAVR